MHRIKAAILLYLSSLERKSFVKLKTTQFFYLVMGLIKPFTVPRACTGWKTKRGIRIKFFLTENYTGLIENFQWATYVCKEQTQLQNFLKKSPCIFVTLHRNHFELFVWEVPWFSDNDCSEFHQWLLWVSPLYNIYSLISPQQHHNYQLKTKMIPILLLVFHLVQAFGAVKGFFTW